MTYAIPQPVVAILLELSPDAAHRRYRTIMLAEEAGSATADLADALRSTRLTVRAETCGDDPNEICVKAYGRDHMDRVWPSTTILLLDPEWDRDAELAQALADDVVEHWDRLRAGAQVIA